MHTAVMDLFRLKIVHKTLSFFFWTTEISKEGNQLTALERKLRTLRQQDSTSPSIKIIGTKRTKLSALYMHKVFESRKTACENFCKKDSNPFGTTQICFTGKYFIRDEIGLELPLNVTQ